MIKPLRITKRLRTIQDHFEPENVTVFKVKTAGEYQAGRGISSNYIVGKQYEAYDGKLTLYPNALGKHQTAELISI